MARASLAEIAAMPFPASLLAVRRAYDPDWRRFDDEGGAREFAVSIDYEVVEEHRFTASVTASSRAEAEKLARAALKEEAGAVEEVNLWIRDPLEQDRRSHPAFDFAGQA